MVTILVLLKVKIGHLEEGVKGRGEERMRTRVRREKETEGRKKTRRLPLHPHTPTPSYTIHHTSYNIQHKSTTTASSHSISCMAPVDNFDIDETMARDYQQVAVSIEQGSPLAR